MIKKSQFIYGVIILIFMIGFATTQAQSAATGSPGQIVSKLEADLANAKSKQVDVLSPSFYKEAQSALMKAKQSLEKGAKISTISQYVAEGSASLRKAEEIAKVSRTILRDTNEARDKALKVEADKLGEPYDKVEKDYQNLTAAIERDNLSYAQESAAKVQVAFRDVEIMAIKNSAIGMARKMMADAKKPRFRRSLQRPTRMPFRP